MMHMLGGACSPALAYLLVPISFRSFVGLLFATYRIWRVGGYIDNNLLADLTNQMGFCLPGVVLGGKDFWVDDRLAVVESVGSKGR